MDFNVQHNEKIFFQYYELKLINNKEVVRIILQNSYQKFKKDSITNFKEKTRKN